MSDPLEDLAESIVYAEGILQTHKPINPGQGRTRCPVCDAWYPCDLVSLAALAALKQGEAVAAQATIAQRDAQVAALQADRDSWEQTAVDARIMGAQLMLESRTSRSVYEQQLAARDAQVAELTAALSDLLSAFVLHRTATHKTRPEYCETCQQGQAEIERAGALLARTPAAPEGETDAQT